MKKSAIYLSLTVFMVFLFLASAFADTISGSGSAGYQVFGSTSESGPQFWANTSWDVGGQKNVGYYLTSTGGGAGVIPDFPGAIPYWGIGTGFDSNFYFHKTGSSGSNVVLKVEVSDYANDNVFGYYLHSDGVLHPLFTGGQSPPATNFLAPAGDYGFYLINKTGNIWKTEGTGKHFAVFQQSSTPGAEIYWIGIEDLPWSNTDKDYNDMIVKVSAVPVPEPSTTLFLVPTVIGLLGLSWKFKN
jgi:hypothetical protein